MKNHNFSCWNEINWKVYSKFHVIRIMFFCWATLVSSRDKSQDHKLAAVHTFRRYIYLWCNCPCHTATTVYYVNNTKKWAKCREKKKKKIVHNFMHKNDEQNIIDANEKNVWLRWWYLTWCCGAKWLMVHRRIEWVGLLLLWLRSWSSALLNRMGACAIAC